MKRELSGYVKLSGHKKGVDDTLKTVVKDLNNSLKKAGENVSIKKIDSKARTVAINIKGDDNSRPHNTLVRLRNLVSAALGKNYKIGVRDIGIKKYVIDVKLDRKPITKFSMPLVKKIKFSGKTAQLEIDHSISTDHLEKGVVDRIVRQVNTRITAQHITGKEQLTKTIKRSEKRLKKYAFQKDPTDKIIESGWVKEFPGAGLWINMPPYVALIRTIQQLIIDEVAKPLGFAEIMLPRLIPLDVARRKGSLSGIPYEMMWVCPPMSRNPEDFADYKDLVEVTGESCQEELGKRLKGPVFGLSHAQCEPFYEIFRKEIVDVDKLPLKYYDVNGPTWRYEAGGLKGLERLNEFQRIEFVYMGGKKDVIKIRDRVMERSLKLLDKVFNVEYRLDSATPVYLEHAGKTEEKKEDFVKSYDVSVILPFKTASRPEAELEISSYHVHTDFYMKRFNVKERTKSEIWTGCSGLSPTRWAFIFLIRHGLDYKKWPKEIRKYIGKELPAVPEMVTWPKVS